MEQYYIPNKFKNWEDQYLALKWYSLTAESNYEPDHSKFVSKNSFKNPLKLEQYFFNTFDSQNLNKALEMATGVIKSSKTHQESIDSLQTFHLHTPFFLIKNHAEVYEKYAIEVLQYCQK